jgi:hypothetical protein
MFGNNAGSVGGLAQSINPHTRIYQEGMRVAG